MIFGPTAKEKQDTNLTQIIVIGYQLDNIHLKIRNRLFKAATNFGWVKKNFYTKNNVAIFVKAAKLVLANLMAEECQLDLQELDMAYQRLSAWRQNCKKAR